MDFVNIGTEILDEIIDSKDDVIAKVGDIIFEVEKIIGKRSNENEISYRIEWKDTWVALNIDDQRALKIPPSIDFYKNSTIGSLYFINDVDKVLLRRVRNETEEFKLKWKTTWCPIHRCSCPELIREFEESSENKTHSVQIDTLPNGH